MTAVYNDADPRGRLDERALRLWTAGWVSCRVSDLGRGMGRYARQRTAVGAWDVGVDLSRGMLNRARQYEPASAAWVTRQCGTIVRRDAAFAAVVNNSRGRSHSRRRLRLSRRLVADDLQ